MGTDRKTEEAHKKSLGVSIDAGGDNGMNPERGNGVFYYLLSVHYIKFDCFRLPLVLLGFSVMAFDYRVLA